MWTLVDLPDDRQAIENKWIFKGKTDADGSTTRENPSSSMGFDAISSAGGRATTTALQLNRSSSVGYPALLLTTHSSSVPAKQCYW